MKKKSLLITLLFSLVLGLAVPALNQPVAAEGLSVSISASSLKPSVGQTITLTVRLSSAMTVDNYDCVLTYDPNYFSFEDNSGHNFATNLTLFDANENKDEPGIVRIVAGAGTQENCTALFSLQFKALQIGSSAFILDKEDFYLNSLPASSIPTVTKTITVVAPVVLSSNNNLKSLEISPGTLTPAFTASQTSYTAEVPMGTSEIAVSATAEDSKASVAVSGNKNLQDGANTVSVVVTAEDGSTKTYTIAVTRAVPTPTPPVTVAVAGSTLAISEPPEGTPAPDGFYHSLTSVGGQLVPSYKALKGDLVLYYLVGTAEQSGFYYFDSASQTYSPFQVMILPSRSFPVLVPDSTASLPAGFSETTLSLNGQTYTAWRQDTPDPAWAGRDVVLLYLMDNRGNKGYFWLDKETLLLIPFSSGQTNGTVSPTPELTPTVSVSPSPTEAAAGPTMPFNPWQLVSILLGFFCLILAGLVVWLATRKVGAAADTYRGSRRVDAPGGPLPDEELPLAPRPVKKPKIRRVD
jgi:hypothetical protein